MASVVAIVPSICLSLTKTVFRNALSAESFSKVLSTVLDERKKARKRRQSASRQKMLLAASGSILMLYKMIQHILSQYLILSFSTILHITHELESLITESFIKYKRLYIHTHTRTDKISTKSNTLLNTTLHYTLNLPLAGKNINGGKMLTSPGRRTRAEIAASVAVVESPISAAVTSVTLTSSVKMRKLSSGNKQYSVTF